MGGYIMEWFIIGIHWVYHTNCEMLTQWQWAIFGAKMMDTNIHTDYVEPECMKPRDNG